MAGGAELEQLSHELESAGGAAAEAAQVLGEEVEELGISGQSGSDTDAAPAATRQEGSSHS